MTEQEKINVDVQQQLALQDAKFNMFIQEMRDFKTEIRDRDNQRAEEIREMRQKHDEDIKEMNQRFYAKFDAMDAKFDKMDAKIDGIGKHVQNITVAAMVGIGAAVIGIGAIAVTVVYTVFTR
ncbi:MAG: DUF1515 family protein [Selenomonadaceae bacterium]|nr:DUF1515 family protein [Selenomonadaceae bacterium]